MMGIAIFPSKGSAQTYYYHADHLNSTRAITNQNGEVINQLDYELFGGEIAATPNNAKKFTGYYRDEEVG